MGETISKKIEIAPEGGFSFASIILDHGLSASHGCVFQLLGSPGKEHILVDAGKGDLYLSKSAGSLKDGAPTRLYGHGIIGLGGYDGKDGAIIVSFNINPMSNNFAYVII